MFIINPKNIYSNKHKVEIVLAIGNHLFYFQINRERKTENKKIWP